MAVQITKSNDPRNLAKLSLIELDDRLEHYFFKVAPHVEHPALLMTPMQSMQEGLARMGAREHKHYAYTTGVEMLLSPLVSGQGGMRKVATGGVVKVDNDLYYHPSLQLHVDESFEVRGDPADCRHVFVKTPSEIVKAVCRGRLQFFERFPGHVSSISQVVLDAQSEINGKRSEEIHAGVNSYQIPAQQQKHSDSSVEGPGEATPTEPETPTSQGTTDPQPVPASPEVKPPVPPLKKDPAPTPDEIETEMKEIVI